MRIISGIYGKRHFNLPKYFRGRPTTEVAKEALFNILQNRLEWEEIRFLDLFAGSGSIGFEALSRGAKEVVAVEKVSKHVAFIRTVAQELGDPRYSIHQRDAFRFIEESESLGKFALIFADPPYSLPQLPQLPNQILSSQLVADNGCLILEHPRDYDFSEDKFFIESREYSAVHFSFFAKKSDNILD